MHQLDSTTLDILAACAKSCKRTAEVFFPHIFWRGFSKQHELLFDLLDSPSRYKLAIMHRGFGKTSIVQTAYCAQQILFNLSKFIMPVSCTADFAIAQTENLKAELQANTDIKNLWGNFKYNEDKDMASFSKKFWVAQCPEGPVAVLPRGWGQQVRGANYRSARPDRIIFDDLEDPKEVMNELIRKEQHDWVLGSAMNCVDRGSEYKIIAIGTIVHQDSLLVKLRQSGQFEVIEAPLCDENYRTLWPQYMSNEQVLAMVKDFRDQGKLDRFSQEYMNMPVAAETASFKPEYFKYYNDGDLVRYAKQETYVIIDPAKTVTIHSDDTAIVGVSLDYENNQIFVRDVVSDKLHYDQIINEALEMCQRLGASVLAAEVTSLNEFITYPLKNEIARRRMGHHVEFVELAPRGRDKNQRIKALVPFYRQGLVWHNKQATTKLEQQLIAFPLAAHDDAMDALAYAIELFEIGGRYMAIKDAAESQEDIEDEYKAIYADAAREFGTGSPNVGLC